MTTALAPTANWPFAELLSAAESVNAKVDPPVVDGAVGPTIVQNGRELVNFASINFLNLHQRPDVLEHFLSASREHGLTTGGSRMTQGISRPHLEMEQEICRVTGKERAISFATGLLANFGFLNAMTKYIDWGAGMKCDNSDAVVVMDRHSHWSLLKAAEHLEHGKRLHTFRHNSPEDLEKVLKRVNSPKVVVVIESVYSADGSIAPMNELIDICEKYGALSFVDDANGFMLYGPENRPFAEEFAAMRRATFVMMSFSKAIGIEGGAIAGPADAINAFEITSGTSMFTAAMQPPTAATVGLLIRTLDGDPSIVDNYLARVERFRARLTEIGAPPFETPSYITSVLIGKDETADLVKDAFIEKGFLIPMFMFPAVKRNQAVMRLIINNDHTEEQLEYFLSTLAELKAKHDF
ncbi:MULTISPECIES: aminotransferase class I/II-fold pyridoxal phosphate-dependent enzyme [unclassified Crossiella]|uniref:aminotransferase class I/II-fold pyridoxal phosphate-dependent enzyme n=1 Tax=unclassified Crossiella TaxID=2620835 RepID=UPI001FFF0F2A|nr:MULTISPECIES: aminotransferase class I/II-fold pyridoxal phosphate-dependent enzyme [unclassified Crossiella]MCK2243990.1 aminotransferase class I/II-fold pyridoxal phosphate-dependent enzyme [Crossiella sp. S99.2]MCK2257152.1 aminotransferase class I/II-fold pyridoxal phosphate-dependent enzyme [Crossiella sp. S99.1]